MKKTERAMTIEFINRKKIEQNVIDVKPTYDKRANPWYAARKMLFRDKFGQGLPVQIFKQILLPQVVHYLKEYSNTVDGERESKINLIISKAKADTERKFNYNFATFIRTTLNNSGLAYFPMKKDKVFTISYKDKQIKFKSLDDYHFNIFHMSQNSNDQVESFYFYNYLDMSVERVSEVTE